MGEFFRGWKRKVGVVTLVMACVFMVGWVRSQFKFDNLEIPCGTARYGVSSAFGGLDFYRLTGLTRALTWRSVNYTSNLLTWDSDEVGSFPSVIEWKWDWAGFRFEVSHIGNRRDEDYMIPYWSIVYPLTMLSAFLLLCTSQKSIQNKITEPSPDEAG
jgi:hypothetical protein